MITQHKFLAQYPISKDSTSLILGTIHPHFTDQFRVDFFYGNESSLWKILAKAFPGELEDPYSLESIKAFLNQRKCSVSDTIITCERSSPTALDEDLIPIELNTSLKEEIRDSNITTIFCTSGFGKNNAFRLFYCDILGLPLDKPIKDNRQVTLSGDDWGRTIQVKALYSPSGAANTGLVRSKAYKAAAHLYEHHPTPVNAFKIDYYRAMFNKVNED